MKMEKIKAVPKYIVERIKKLDNIKVPKPTKFVRYYFSTPDAFFQVVY